MSFYSKLRGTIETIFQIGLGGPQLKANAGTIEHRNATDAAFAIARGADPVGVNDLTTKQYVDAQVATDVGAIREIRMPFGFADAPFKDSVAQIPATAFVIRARTEITTPFTGGTTIQEGQAGAVAIFQGAADNDPTTNNIYQTNIDVSSTGLLSLRVSIGGAPVAGVGVAIVEYSIPNV